MMRRLLPIAFPLWLLALTACGDDEGGAGILSTTGPTGSGSSAPDDEGGADSTGGGEVAPCEVDPEILVGGFDVLREDAELVVVGDACGGLVGPSETQLDVDADNFNIHVYRPTTNGQWPAGLRPAVFFVTGAGQAILSGTQDNYPDILRALAAQGFVVFAADPPPPGEWTSAKRATLLACMMLFAKAGPTAGGWSQGDQNRISDVAILSGHSRGGGADDLLMSQFATFQQDIAGMEAYNLCAVAPIAPAWSVESGTNVVLADADAPPYFVVQGATDEDTRDGGVFAFDAMVPESDFDLDGTSPGVQTAPLRDNDKAILWIYGVEHNDFGGGQGAQSAEAGARAQRSAAYYLPLFLRWQLAHDATSRAALMRLMDPTPNDLEFPAMPATLADPAIWEELAQYDLLDRPLIFAGYQQGLAAAAARRYVVDVWDRQTTHGELAPPTCATAQGSLGTSTAGLPVLLGEGLVTDQVCHATTLDTLTAAGDSWQNTHQTRAATVEWGGVLGSGGTIEWSLDDAEDVAELDLSQYSHVSLRVANIVEADPIDCQVIDPDAFELEVELVTQDDQRGEHAHTVSTGLHIEQSVDAYPISPPASVCQAFQYMRTVRIPMSEFCGPSSDPATMESVKAIRVRFPDDANTEHRAFIDSLEFTADPLDPASSYCGLFSGAWNCMAGSGLVVKETSCSAEPTATSTCPSGSVVATTLSKPTVAADDDWPTSFPGWVVYSPKGWVRDVQSPTTTELNRIKGLCQAACALEWSDDPAVAATCTAASAFSTPTLRKANAVGPAHRIPESRRHGGGIFGTQALSCDLEDDCCEAFDELSCGAKHLRTTTAASAIARAEEYRMTLGGTSTKVTFATPSGSTSLPLAGSVGFSFCPAGDGSVSCPFYLGSLELASSGSTTVSATCPDSSSIAIDVSDLSIELLQPAFGIADQADYDKAIPEGGLHFLAKVAVEGATYAFRAVNEHDVIFMSAKRTGFDADDITLTFDVPCGGATIPVTAQFDLHNTATPASPPTVTINNASTAACPSVQTLSATASDPNGDLVTPVRWEVDGVRMAPGTSSIAFTRSHVLKAYGRDARGATTTKTKTVSCQ